MVDIGVALLGRRRRCGSWTRAPEGFEWIDAGNADQNVLSFVRRDAHGAPGIACIANFSPVVRYDFRVGLPLPGHWTEVLNTDSDAYGGSGIGNMGAVEAEAQPMHAFGYSAALTLPPLAVLWLAPPDPRDGCRHPLLNLAAIVRMGENLRAESGRAATDQLRCITRTSRPGELSEQIRGLTHDHEHRRGPHPAAD